MAVSGAELLAVAFAALPAEEQDEAFERIAAARIARLAEAEEAGAYFVRSLRRVADEAGGELTPAIYRQTRAALVALAEVETVHKIEARFRARVRGKPRPFTVEELLGALARCAEALGGVPLVAEYDAWRRRELELARIRGVVPRVPSPAPFRRRFGSWHHALLAAGHDPDTVYRRLEPDAKRRAELAKVDRYTEKTLRTTLERCAQEIGHVPTSNDFDAWRRRVAKRSRRKALVLPSNSPYRRRFGTWERALLYFGFAA